MSLRTHPVSTRAGVIGTVLALVLLCLLWASSPARAKNAPVFLQVLIDEVTPQTVTATDDPAITVRGTVRNVGDRPVTDVVVRLERADAVTTGSELRSNLHGRNDQYRPIGEFVTLTDTLAPGQQHPFTMAFPLRAENGPSWDIDQPGVYPALVNVNGTPDYGAPARLDDARFLLPVLGAPLRSGAPTTQSPAEDTPPVPLTMLWPLADRPRLVPGQPGGPAPARLLDDQLAQFVSPGGRLDVLLGAVEQATAAPADPHGDLGRALCLAIDPDLLVTATDMTYGYQVLDNPAEPAGPTHPGSGQAAATAWLDRLRLVSQRMCVSALPYAQADLDAVARIGDDGLSDIATGGADEVDRILGVGSVRGVGLLGDEPLSGTAAALLGRQGPTVAVVAPPPSEDASSGLAVRRVSDAVVAAPYDPATSAALAAAGATPVAPAYVPQSVRFDLQHDSRAARLQDALGAIVWPALAAPQAPPVPQILMPAAAWDLSPAEAQAVLSTTATLLRSGRAVARPLPAVVDEARAAAQGDPLDTGFATESASSVDDWTCQSLGDQVRRLWGLTAALAVDERTGLTGAQYTQPLRQDALRAVSLSVPVDARADAGRVRLEAIQHTVGDLFNAVTVVNPGDAFTLATEHSPLPLVLRNELPVPIRAVIKVDTPAGMKVTDVGVQELPPGYLPVKIPIEVNVTQRMAVDVSLHTPEGLALGEPVRLSVHSNAYGKLLFIITLSAATVLFALTGRRLWHRFRGQPDRADLDRDDEPWQP